MSDPHAPKSNRGAVDLDEMPSEIYGLEIAQLWQTRASQL